MRSRDNNRRRRRGIVEGRGAYGERERFGEDQEPFNSQRSFPKQLKGLLLWLEHPVSSSSSSSLSVVATLDWHDLLANKIAIIWFPYSLVNKVWLQNDDDLKKYVIIERSPSFHSRTHHRFNGSYVPSLLLVIQAVENIKVIYLSKTSASGIHLFVSATWRWLLVLLRVFIFNNSQRETKISQSRLFVATRAITITPWNLVGL